MDFDFSDDQKVIRDEARKLLEGCCDRHRVRQLLERGQPCDAELWRALADNGWLGTAIDEAHGGLGLGRVTLCVIAEEIGRALAPVPVSSSLYLAAEAVQLCDNAEAAETLLPLIASGERIVTVALAERMRPLHAASRVACTVRNGAHRLKPMSPLRCSHSASCSTYMSLP